ncbi:MAG: insulinase family protein, partial [Bacteroidetes bacterium]
YQEHPYRWPTIGKVPEHVSEASLEEVKAFYEKYYAPNNAVLVIAGRVNISETRRLVEKWFGHIPARPMIERRLPTEPPQRRFQRRVLHDKAPADALYLAFHIPSRVDADYYGVDLLSDVLGNGPSSRLYRRLLKERTLFSAVDCYITGTIDPGLLIIEAKPLEGVSLDNARAAIWAELEELKTNGIPARELEKLQNKVESTLAFSELSILNKAINLAFFEVLGNAELINQEVHLYRRVDTATIQRLAQQIFVEENCSDVSYELPQARPLVVS